MFEIFYIVCLAFSGQKLCMAQADGFANDEKKCIMKGISRKDSWMKENPGWVIVALSCVDLTDMVKGQDNENPSDSGRMFVTRWVR